MKFCKSNCRHNYKNRRIKFENDVKAKDLHINKLQNERVNTELEISENKNSINKIESEKQQNYENIRKVTKAISIINEATDKQLYDYISNKEINKENDLGEKDYLRDSFRFTEEKTKKEIVSNFRKDKKAHYNSLLNQYKTKDFSQSILKIEVVNHLLENKIERLKKEIEKLEEHELKMNLPESPNESSSKKLTRKERFEVLKKDTPSIELGGGEVRRMHFDTYNMKGELGRFLGELDHNKVAFALTGDSGAGKSYFSFELAKLFLSNRKTVKYFSLEEGIGKLTREKLTQFQIGNELKITSGGTLEDVDNDADRFDVIIVDSFSKLTRDQKEFDLLRHNHPQTLFIMIFQKTTAKTMIGGAAIKYDSSAMIDVKIQDGERIAVMEKGRYGTQGWIYSITESRIISRS